MRVFIIIVLLKTVECKSPVAVCNSTGVQSADGWKGGVGRQLLSGSETVLSTRSGGWEALPLRAVRRGKRGFKAS